MPDPGSESERVFMARVPTRRERQRQRCLLIYLLQYLGLLGASSRPVDIGRSCDLSDVRVGQMADACAQQLHGSCRVTLRTPLR